MDPEVQKVKLAFLEFQVDQDFLVQKVTEDIQVWKVRICLFL